MLQLNNIKETLALFKTELVQRYPIASLGLFGSVVRDDFTENSDIDIIVTFSKPIGSDFITLADELEDKLKRRVDLVSRAGVKEKYLRVIDPEIVYV
ncbi:MAG: nucleotidyltransferase domain-containing protein [Bacteroidota bacterium]